MNEFKIRKGLIVQGSGSNIFDVQGSQGQLFSITDSLSGSLFSVNDISGIPIMEVFSDNTIKLGTFNNEAIIVSGSRTGMGIATPQAKLHISGASNSGLFEIDSPAVNNILFVSGSGNVGIGTATPTRALYVSSSAWDNTLGAGVIIENSNTVGSGLTLKPSNSVVTNGSNGWAIYAGGPGAAISDGNLGFWAHGTNEARLVIQRAGNVGIGETSPSARLEIRGSGATSATTALRVENSNASASLVVLDNGNIGIGTTTPQFKLHVLGTAGGDATFNGGILVENNNATDGEAALAFRVNSMAAASNYWFTGINQSNNYDIAYGTSFTNANTALSISSSRNIGIGTISPSAQLHISGSATTPLRIQNPATTLMQISSSVANSGSIVFFGTTPTAAGLDLEIQSNGAANGGQVRIAGNGTQWDFGSVSAVARNGTGNSEMFSATMTGTSTTLVQNPVRIQFNANQSSAGGGGYTVLRLNATHASTAGTGSKLLQTWEFGGVAQSVMDISGSLGIGTGSAPSARLFISGASNQALFEIDSPAVNNIIYVSGSGNVGIGTNLPSAELHISGASADSLLRVGSPTNSDIFFVNGNGRVGINTTSSRAFFSGSGGFFGSGEGNIAPTLTIFQSSSATGLNAAGLQIVGSGSSAFAAARLNILTMGDKYAYLNIGTSGSGTENNYWEFTKASSTYAHTLYLSNYSNGVFQSNIMALVPGANTSTIGTNNQIFLEGSTGYIGLQTSNTGTQEWIHLYSAPDSGEYIRIDAAQTSNSPPLTAATAKNGYGIVANNNYLAEPDYWMEIKLAANVVLIPCYLPA